MMPAAYVKAYVKRNKTDAADAEAICEAVTRVALANKIALTIWALRQGRYLRNDLIRRQSAETSSVPMLS
jgi:transposase